MVGKWGQKHKTFNIHVYLIENKRDQHLKNMKNTFVCNYTHKVVVKVIFQKN